jgi:hypothetical protein
MDKLPHTHCPKCSKKTAGTQDACINSFLCRDCYQNVMFEEIRKADPKRIQALINGDWDVKADEEG